MKTIIAGLIIIVLTGYVNTQEVEAARGMDIAKVSMDSAKVSESSGLGGCPKGKVDVKFVSFEEMKRLQGAVCKTQATSGGSTSKGCSGPVTGLYTGGKVYATDLDSAITQLSHYCGW